VELAGGTGRTEPPDGWISYMTSESKMSWFGWSDMDYHSAVGAKLPVSFDQA
jgi:hypothetical protein